MRAAAIALIVASSFALGGGSACAMSKDQSAVPECIVTGGEKLPAATGGAAGICAAVNEALNTLPAGQSVRVQIQVKSHSWLVARIERDGALLPEQNMAVADSKLTKGSVERFARAIAQAVSTAG